jgi:hypothetical protein
MAARRLLIALIVLLVLSTVAAILVPPPPGSEDESERTATTTTEQAAAPRGRLERATLDAGHRQARPIRLRVGDQLILRVRSRRFHTVRVDGFGQIEATDRFAPATFDLLADAPGSHAVRLLDAARVIGRIDVQPRGDQEGGS